MPHISIRNLNVTYGDQEALKDITVDIPDGEITAIIGPSGCGKTTLLKSLNRLNDLSDEVKVRGEVLIDGVNIYNSKADILSLRKKIGFLSQKPYPLPMSIYDNIAYGPKIHRMNGSEIVAQIAELEKHCPMYELCSERASLGRNGERDRLVECYLRLSGLWDEVKDRLRQPASRLSVGQQQRLALARALAVGPEAILADEPTSALDPISAQLIEKQFQLLKKNFTIIVVTHILRQARRLADYVIFLYMGKLIEHGPAGKIFTEPEQPETQAYISGEIS
ncbi:MAG: phosphate ABC transporter ATP-binding protein [Actinomycetota bacterium]